MRTPELRGEIDGDFVPRRRHDLASTTLDGETVIHDRARLFHLDPIATVVWECCDGTISVDALASELAATFRVDTDTARRDVLAAVRAMATDGLLAGAAARPSSDPAAEAPRPSHDDVEIRFDVGGLLLGVSTDHAGARTALRTILAPYVTDAPGEPAAAYALEFASAAANGAPSSPHTLYDQDGPVLESADPNRVLRALLTSLAAHADLAADGIGALPAVAVGRDGVAVVVARAPEVTLDRAALAYHRLAVADGAVAFIDCSGGVVVGAPGLDVDLDALDQFAATLPAERDETPPLPWGRSSVLALATDAPGDAEHALIRLGPIADDDTPALSGADLALDALLGLLATVPIVSANDPEALAGALAEPSR